MSTSAYFAKRFAAELPAFNRVARALPADQLHYTPHEKNTPAGKLAWQLVMEMHALADIFKTGEARFGAGLGAMPDGRDDIAAALEKSGNDALEAVKNIDDARWNGPGKAMFGDDPNAAWADTVVDMAWGFLLDMVHHRGQLSAYLRPMGGKVPSIYGPTADDAA